MTDETDDRDTLADQFGDDFDGEYSVCVVCGGNSYDPGEPIREIKCAYCGGTGVQHD